MLSSSNSFIEFSLVKNSSFDNHYNLKFSHQESPIDTAFNKVSNQDCIFSSQKDSDAELEEIILKKRRKNTKLNLDDFAKNETGSEDFDSIVSTQDEGIDEKVGHSNICSVRNDKFKASKVKIATKNCKIEKVSKNQKPRPCSKKVIEKKILKAAFDHKNIEVVYVVEYSESQGKKSTKSLTRRQVLQDDPGLLLRFYESYLKFTKNTDFNPENLQLPAS